MQSKTMILLYKFSNFDPLALLCTSWPESLLYYIFLLWGRFLSLESLFDGYLRYFNEFYQPGLTLFCIKNVFKGDPSLPIKIYIFSNFVDHFVPFFYMMSIWT